MKVDLKDAYFTIPIDSGHQQYLKFTLEGESYQFTSLLFNLSCAPCTFTKVLKPVMTLLRSWGVRIIVYIDDMLILAETPEQASQHFETLLCLGVHCQSRQICVHSSPANRVSGSSSQLSVNGAQSLRGETETDKGRGHNAPLPITSVSLMGFANPPWCLIGRILS